MVLYFQNMILWSKADSNAAIHGIYFTLSRKRELHEKNNKDIAGMH